MHHENVSFCSQVTEGRNQVNESYLKNKLSNETISAGDTAISPHTPILPGSGGWGILGKLRT